MTPFGLLLLGNLPTILTNMTVIGLRIMTMPH